MRTTWGGRAKRGWPRMDSLWLVPRAKLGRFGNDEKASCVTVSRRRSVLPSPCRHPLVPPDLRLSPSSPCTEENLGLRSIHLNIIISFRELGFQGILVSLFLSPISLSLSLPLPPSSFHPLVLFPAPSLSLLDDLIVRSAHESSTSLFSPSVKFTFRPSPPSGPIYPPPSPAPSTFRSTITYGSIGYGR